MIGSNDTPFIARMFEHCEKVPDPKTFQHVYRVIMTEEQLSCLNDIVTGHCEPEIINKKGVKAIEALGKIEKALKREEENDD